MFFTQYVLPSLIIAGIAGVLAFLLAFLGKFFAVKTDERIDKVAERLAGANCGGCGYAGCKAFAEALVKGEAEINKCNPTGIEDKREIARILGVEVQESEPTVAVVHCMGGDDCNTKFRYEGYYSCESEELFAGGNKACPYGCLGLGTCSRTCPYHAVSVVGGVSSINGDKCRSCGACIAKCPKRIIDRIPARATVYIGCSSACKGKEVMGACKKGCIACGKCARTCKEGAIELIDNLPHIDYSKCVGCNECAAACPRKCIVVRKPPLAVRENTEDKAQ